MIGAAGDERHVSLVGAQREVDLLLHSSRHLLGAQFALLRLGHIGVDRPQSRLCLFDSTAGIDEHVLDGGWKWSAETLTGEWSQGLADGGRRFCKPADDLGIVDHPAHDGGETGETTRADLYADGVAHDVFELVRLVDHHHFVLRQQHVSTGHVQAVEVQVDHDHVGHRGPSTRQLGEAHRTHRALRPAGALVAADTDGLPRTIVRRPVEVGLITGLGGAATTR